MILTCITTMILNISGIGFSKDPRDLKSFKRAAYVCGSDKRYEDGPCLIKFMKVENGVYRALCGHGEII